MDKIGTEARSKSLESRRGILDSECIRHCIECSTLCMQTMHHCLERGGRHALAEHISLLMNCSEVCRVSANFMMANSEFTTEIANVCANLCRECANQCESIDDEDPVMKECTKACWACAESCDEYGT